MKDNTPLLIVDLQKCFGDHNNIVEKIRDRLKDRSIVIQTRFEPKNKLYEEVLNWKPSNSDLSLWIPEVGSIIEKNGYGLDCSGLNKLRELLNGAKEVEICGYELDGCILATCYQIWDMGIKPKPIFELCGGIENRLETQSITKHIFGI